MRQSHLLCVRAYNGMKQFGLHVSQSGVCVRACMLVRARVHLFVCAYLCCYVYVRAFVCEHAHTCMRVVLVLVRVRTHMCDGAAARVCSGVHAFLHTLVCEVEQGLH